MDSSFAGGSVENLARMNPAPKPSIDNTLEKLQKLWTVMGFNEEEKAERVHIFNTYVSCVLDELYQEEDDQYKKLKKIIEQSKKEVEELCWQLGMPCEKFPFPDDLPALQMEKQISSQLNSLKKEKSSREKALNTLREIEKELCLLLDTSPLQLSTCTEVPTKQDLLELEQHVKMMEVEKDHRMREYCSSKRELTTIMEETEYLPDTSFGANLFFGEDKNIILSQQNIKELKDLVEKAYHKKCEIERELQSLKERLQTLWDRLNIDEHDRTTFLTTYSGCKMSVINAFEREIVKCEELKKKNIGKYIAKMRDELTELWDKCYYSQEERENFEYFYSDDFTETLLDVHDAEVQRLKEYYKTNEKIFCLISRRNQLWENMILFEKKASDPNRFINRGGQLLQEEKERNRLVKELPRLESEILDLILQYEDTTGKKFLVNGKDFEKVVEEQRRQHAEERERGKLERQRQRASSNTRPLANCLNMTPVKRQLNTPLRTPNKFRRMNPGMSTLRVPGGANRAGLSLTPAAGFNKSPKNRSRMLRKSPRTVPRRKNTTSGEHMLRNENEAPKSKGTVTDGNLIESISTYSEFTRELNKSKRSNCRSSSKYFLRSRSCSPKRKLTPFHGKLGLPFLI